MRSRRTLYRSSVESSQRGLSLSSLKLLQHGLNPSLGVFHVGTCGGVIQAHEHLACADDTEFRFDRRYGEAL